MEFILFFVILVLIYLLNRIAYKLYLIHKDKATQRGYYHEDPNDCIIPSAIVSVITFFVNFSFNVIAQIVVLMLTLLTIIVYFIIYKSESGFGYEKFFKKIFFINDKNR